MKYYCLKPHSEVDESGMPLCCSNLKRICSVQVVEKKKVSAYM